MNAHVAAKRGAARRPLVECDARVRLLPSIEPLAEPALDRAIAHEFLIFDAFVAGKRRVDVHPLVIDEALHQRAVAAAEGVTAALRETADRAHRSAEERARYRLGPIVEGLARASFEGEDLASVARVDLLLGADGEVRACELNADCPGGYNEAYGLPRLARRAGFFDGHDPTDAIERLCDRLVAASEGRAIALLYATAYAEDLQVCALLQRLLRARGAEAILTSPAAPLARDDGVYVGAVRIGAIYRFFPTEYMEGQRNLPGLERAIAMGHVRTVASFAEIFAQSKLAMARAWSLRSTLSQSAREAIDRHLPETRELDGASRSMRAMLVSDREGWVLKRALGRVGDQVHVGALFEDHAWVARVDDAIDRARKGESWIAQRFVPQRTVPTPWGPRLVTLGAYVIEGHFCGYFARITASSHVSHDALCVPVFVAR
ncbi:MAG: glutathionylspermidine synthase family protein [Polyangiales bacterium]